MTSIIVYTLLGIAIVVLLAVSYIKAPPDVAYIVSGLRKRVVIGRASLRIPFLERLDKLILRLISIDVKTSTPLFIRSWSSLLMGTAGLA